MGVHRGGPRPAGLLASMGMVDYAMCHCRMIFDPFQQCVLGLLCTIARAALT
jgi:hypothetical protein